MSGIVLSLFDLTGNMVRPWAEAGYECICVDIQQPPGWGEIGGDGWRAKTFGGDIRNWLPPPEQYAFVFAFPPCTDQAVSGARWFQDKGLAGLAGAVELVERSRDIAEWSGAEWIIENPVSTMSSYWRKPDYSFHPGDYADFCLNDNYSKKTCLWASPGVIMPKPARSGELPPMDDRIHKAPPGPGRANFRSATPMGFARAFFEANARAVA